MDLELNEPQENYGTGWIAIYRSVKKHWIWNDPVKFQWWVYILMEVNHSDNKVLIGNELIICKRGESLKSLRSWAKELRTTPNRFRIFLQLLQKDSMISLKTVTKTTHITVCNYESYQKSGTTIDTKTKQRRYNNRYNNRTTIDTITEHDRPTNNNYNNINNEKNDNNSKNENKEERKAEEKFSSLSSDVSFSPDLKEEIRKDLVDMYYEWSRAKLGVEPQYDGSDGNAMKQIISYLSSQFKSKEEIKLNWGVVLSSYDKWDPFYKKQTRVRQINSNLSNIINQIKNHEQLTRKNTRPTVDDVLAEFRRQQAAKSASNSNQSTI